MNTLEKNPDTEQKILEIAKSVFKEKGYLGADMQEIAEQAGVDLAALQLYFVSKDHLFKKIAGMAFSNFMPKLLKIIGSDMDVFEKIRAFVFEYTYFINKDSYLPLFILTEINRNPEFMVKEVFKDHLPDMDKFFIEINQAIKDEKIIDIPPVQLMMNIMSLAVFPFLGKPLFKLLLGIDEEEFSKAIQYRMLHTDEFIISAIRK